MLTCHTHHTHHTHHGPCWISEGAVRLCPPRLLGELALKGMMDGDRRSPGAGAACTDYGLDHRGRCGRRESSSNREDPVGSQSRSLSELIDQSFVQSFFAFLLDSWVKRPLRHAKFSTDYATDTPASIPPRPFASRAAGDCRKPRPCLICSKHRLHDLLPAWRNTLAPP